MVTAPRSLDHSTASIGARGRFWIATIAVSAASVVVLSLGARHLAQGELAKASAVLAMSFVMSVVPGGLQLSAAAAAADGRRDEPRRRWHWAPSLAIVVAAAPIAIVTGMAVLAVAAVGLQLVPATALARRRGALIGLERFGGAAASLGVEAAGRVVLGFALLAAAGSTGLAVALVGASTLSLRLTRVPALPGGSKLRPETAPLHSVVSLGAVAMLANLDLIMANTVLGPARADAYAHAALPARGIFVLLLAAGWLTFPLARRSAGRRAVVVPIALTVIAGVALASGLVVGRPLVAVILGAHPATVTLGLLGLAMAFASGTSVATNLAVARGIGRPWRLLVVPLVVLGVAAVLLHTPASFAVLVLVVQALALSGALVQAARR